MLRGRSSAQLSDAVAEVADEATAHLLAARSLCADVPKPVRSILLPTTLADHILAHLQRHAYDPFAAGIGSPQGGPSLQLALLWRRWTSSY